VVQLGARIAYAHHERFDGTGYPQGLAGTAIPLEGRIVAVADVFDALTTARPYKPAWPLVEARAFLLEGRGRHFDPDCVDAFLAGWEEALDIRAHFGES
jgi:putative two-component system response regulator